MAVNIDGSAWPTSGAVTNTTVGLAASAITGTLTHVGTTNVPSGSAATGVLRQTENSAAAIRFDPLATISGLSVGDFYVLRFWIRAVKTSTGPTSKSDYGLFAWDNTNFLTLKFETNSDGSQGWTPTASTAVIAGGTTDSIMKESGPEPVIPWGSASDNVGWCEVVLRVKRHGSTGLWECWINGNYYYYKTGLDTAAMWTAGFAASSFNLNLPAWVGAYWEVCAPIITVHGAAPSFSVTPQTGLIPSDALATKFWLPFCTAQAAGDVYGRHFQVSGSGTVTVDTEYLNQSGSPCRHRFKMAGNGNTPVVTTIPTIGTLPYNEQGWGHVAISDLLVPTSGYAIWTINYSGGSACAAFFASGGSLFVKMGSGAYLNVGAFTHASVRYCIILHLNVDGRAAFTMIDLTSQPGAAGGNVTTTTSRMLADWTPGDLGTMSITAGPTASDIEAGYMAVYKRPTLYTVDSIATGSHAPASGNTTAIKTPICVARSFPMGRESQCLPGAWYPHVLSGMSRRMLLAPLGRSGLTRRDFTRNVLGPMQFTFGCEIMGFDLGSVNDVALITTGSSTDCLGAMEGYLDEFFKWAVLHDNAVWMATMLPRDLRTFTITGVSVGANAVLTLGAGHGLATGSYRCEVSGVVGNATMQNAINVYMAAVSATSGGSSLTTTINTTGGTYTSGGTVKGYTSVELAAITTLNTLLQTVMARRQAKGLLKLSDIAAAAAATPSRYPNNSTFWSDQTHPSTGSGSTAGGQVIAEDMVSTVTVVSAATADAGLGIGGSGGGDWGF